MTSPVDLRRRSRRPAWAGRNYSLLTAAAFVTNLGSHGALIAAAFAVLEAGEWTKQRDTGATYRTAGWSSGPARCNHRAASWRWTLPGGRPAKRSPIAVAATPGYSVLETLRPDSDPTLLNSYHGALGVPSGSRP